MSSVMLRVSARTRDEARDLASYTGQTLTAAVEAAVHEAAIRAYHARLAAEVAATMADPDQREDYERETGVWVATASLPDEEWTENDFLGFDDEPPARRA